ncbi:uncharacterized protein PFL1_04748 [Pseudozyma flocculosa PF-1]|uniref:Uncharacterized protein n=2 Tax=Pseudozyma flocculosa TaxID=84751 RepID=A0A5C3F4I7_9BASI|nr:uncharacterized protein PFL1_04748 [Pseudozyma flocculosa PF-1]EPQ27610.1 hypothetical protein PFL1_04748 [Pseudozyma flocculosa PF-1]SPO39262.1 uncharacterized protein PSFLO_04742 [Pseudozyma flocculosa]
MPSLYGIFSSSSTSTAAATTTTKTANKSKLRNDKKQSAASARHNAARHRVHDVTYGPPPPRGSVTTEKLFYLDWRLAHIRDSRLSSQDTGRDWADGRNTIGRTSFEICQLARDQDRAESSSSESDHIAAVAAAADRRAYADEKAEGIVALKQALMVDNALVNVPLLARVDSYSGSDGSSSDDNHPAAKQQQQQPQQKDAVAAAAAAAVKARPTSSIFHRASRKISSVGNRPKTQEGAANPAAAAATAKVDRRASLRGRMLPMRLWQS